MGMRRRGREQQEELFITADQLPKSDGHVLYTKLDKLLSEADFDRQLVNLCQPYYADPSQGAAQRQDGGSRFDDFGSRFSSDWSSSTVAFSPHGSGLEASFACQARSDC